MAASTPSKITSRGIFFSLCIASTMRSSSEPFMVRSSSVRKPEVNRVSKNGIPGNKKSGLLPTLMPLRAARQNASRPSTRRRQEQPVKPIEKKRLVQLHANHHFFTRLPGGRTGCQASQSAPLFIAGNVHLASQALHVYCVHHIPRAADWMVRNSIFFVNHFDGVR